MQILKDCFESLDEDGSAAIGVDELEDPLIALGLVDNREQVEEMVLAIDDDGDITFDEFLKLVKGSTKTKATMANFMNKDANDDADIIFDFFKRLTNKQLQPKDQELPFSLFYSSERRKKILEAIMGHQDRGIQKKSGRILDNYRQQLTDQMKRVKQDRKEMQEQNIRPNPSELSTIQFMDKRVESFDRNEIDPEILRSLINDLKRN